MSTVLVWAVPRPLLGSARALRPEVVAVVGGIAVVVTGVAATQGLVTGLVLVMATAVGLTMLRYPALGGYCVAGMVPVLSGIERGVPIPGLRPSEALVGLCAVVVLIPAYRSELQRWTAVDGLAFAFAAVSVVLPVWHLVARGQPVTLSVMASMFLPLQFFLLYRTARVSLVSDVQRRLGQQLVLTGSLVVSLIAVMQQLDMGPTRSLVQRFTGSESLDSFSYQAYARATGPFQHWLPLAGYLTVIILFTVALLLDAEQTVMSRSKVLAILGANVAALMLTVTFAAMFAVVVGSLYLGWKAGRLRKAVVWLSAGSVIVALLFGSYVVTRWHNQYIDANGMPRHSLIPQTVETRINVWRSQYLPAMFGRWASGYGPDLPPDVTWTHTESIYVTLLLRGGIPLLAIFVALMLTISRRAARAANTAALRPAARAIVAVTGVLWIMHLLYPYFTSSGLPQPYWALAGIALRNDPKRVPTVEQGVL